MEKNAGKLALTINILTINMIFCACLEISSFTYCGSIGAEHFYGKIDFPDITKVEKLRLKKPLSQKEATYLNKKEGTRAFARYKMGDLSDRFKTKAELIKFAVDLFKYMYPKCFLKLGNAASVSAKPLVYWPKGQSKFAKRINALAKEWDDIGGYGDWKRGVKAQPERAEQIDDEWYKLMKPLLYPKE